MTPALQRCQGFRAPDIFALIHSYGILEFDVSFVRSECLELFCLNYERKKHASSWQGLAVQAVSRHSEIKKVTILTHDKSLSYFDVITWLGHYKRGY